MKNGTEEHNKCKLQANINEKKVRGREAERAFTADQNAAAKKKKTCCNFPFLCSSHEKFFTHNATCNTTLHKPYYKNLNRQDVEKNYIGQPQRGEKKSNKRETKLKENQNQITLGRNKIQAYFEIKYNA